LQGFNVSRFRVAGSGVLTGSLLFLSRTLPAAPQGTGTARARCPRDSRRDASATACVGTDAFVRPASEASEPAQAHVGTDAFVLPASEASRDTTKPTRRARLPIAQHPRNPSPRDREILTLLAEGHTRKQAAAALHLKPRTITATIQRMCDRYGAANPLALIAAAIRLEWIALEIDVDTQDTAP